MPNFKSSFNSEASSSAMTHYLPKHGFNRRHPESQIWHGPFFQSWPWWRQSLNIHLGTENDHVVEWSGCLSSSAQLINKSSDRQPEGWSHLVSIWVSSESYIGDRKWVHRSKDSDLLSPRSWSFRISRQINMDGAFPRLLTLILITIKVSRKPMGGWSWDRLNSRYLPT